MPEPDVGWGAAGLKSWYFACLGRSAGFLAVVEAGLCVAVLVRSVIQVPVPARKLDPRTAVSPRLAAGLTLTIC
ncbi:hypothetical protein ABIB27_001707 [Arthrobacter sp. UYEF21]